MLLNRLRQVRDERGAALAAVMGLMFLLSVISVTVLSVSITANAFATSTRANVQARAAAQAGLDAVFAAVNVGTFTCAMSSATAPIYAATAVYTDKTGATLGCSGGVVTGRPVQAVVVATGTASAKGIKASNGDTATATATFAITITNPPTFVQHALFGDKTVLLNNATALLESAPGLNDASVYSNGDINCQTKFKVQGTMVSAGNITIANTCNTTKYVWAGGNVSITQSAAIAGDVYQAGTAQMTLGNSSSQIGGNVFTNGTVNLVGAGAACPSTSPSPAASAAVCGTVAAFGAGANTIAAPIAGSVYATGSVAVSSPIAKDLLSVGGSLSGSAAIGGSARAQGTIGIPRSSIAGTACQNTSPTASFPACGTLSFPAATNPVATLPSGLGYPAGAGAPVVNAPVIEQLPQIQSSDSALDMWRSVGYTVTSVPCAGLLTAIAGMTGSKNLLLLTGCTAPVTLPSLTLTGDLAVLSPMGILTNNGWSVTSVGTARNLFLIVPSDAPGISWNPIPGSNPVQYSPSCTTTSTNQTITTANTQVVSNTSVFLYSPCTVNVSGVVSGFRGEVYGGTVIYPNNTDLTMGAMSVPGIRYPGTPPPVTYSAVVSSRFMAGG